MNVLEPKAESIFKKYLRKDNKGNIVEDSGQSFVRVAMGVSAYDYRPSEIYPQLLDQMMQLKFLFNRPAWYGIGRNYGFCSACTFLQMKDSLIKGDRSIMQTLFNATAIQQAGGGVGWDISLLRPRGAIVKSTGGQATGPLDFIRGFDPTLKTVEQGGYLMGANNVGLRVDYPSKDEVLRFINAKLEENSMTQFNTNLVITDEFIKNPDTEIWDALINAMWVNGGIGVQFYDTWQKHNAIPGYGEIQGTNPCSEFAMFHGESCQPSYINMNKFLRHDGTIDWNDLANTIRIATRSMDNLIDANRYLPSVPILEEMAKSTRRMGIGPTGVADVLIKMGIKYNTKQAVDFVGVLMEFIMYHALKESIKLSGERGPFPFFDMSVYASGDFEQPQPIMPYEFTFGRGGLDWNGLIPQLKDGIRNCGVTVIAPSSFGSQTMSTEGYGIEPVFMPSFKRNFGDGSQTEYNSGLVSMPAFMASHEISPYHHVYMVAAAQRFVTEAISKTVNMPHNATKQDVADVVKLAWRTGCKSITVYRSGSREVEALEPCQDCAKPPEDIDDIDFVVM